MSKFYSDFHNVLQKIQNKENFAFTRFSDGELYIMQNRKVVISQDTCFLREEEHVGSWGPEEHKSFNPETDGFLREKLLECFMHKQEGYYKGICTAEDVGEVDASWQFEKLLDLEDDDLTFSNLLINGNYFYFMTKMLPAMKDSNFKVVYVCNKMADLEKFPLNLVKDFRVGQNCHINDIHLVEEMTDWIQTNSIKDHLFLFSASSLSNILIYELYKKFPNNTYMDIGSTLNPMLGLSGWVSSRGYLRGYWMNEPNPYYYQQCRWWGE